jgi:hypothetical protein
MGWQGWIAALGGVVAIVGIWFGGDWSIGIGGGLAIIFGAWAAMSGGHATMAGPNQAMPAA